MSKSATSWTKKTDADMHNKLTIYKWLKPSQSIYLCINSQFARVEIMIFKIKL